MTAPAIAFRAQFTIRAANCEIRLRKECRTYRVAKAGTSVVLLLKLVRAFGSIVNGCSLAPKRWVWLRQSSSVANSLPK